MYYVWWVHGSMASNKVVRIKATLSSFQRLMCRTTIDEGGMLHFLFVAVSCLRMKRNQEKSSTKDVRV